jgi:UPF0716 family protein affecting phage T7 exclusion
MFVKPSTEQAMANTTAAATCAAAFILIHRTLGLALSVLFLLLVAVLGGILIILALTRHAPHLEQ